MESSPSELHARVRDLRRAAARVAQEADSAVPGDLPGLLDQLETTLRELSTACYSLGPSMVPRPESVGSDRNSCRHGGASRAEERTALALTRLHEVGAAVGGAARRCRAAKAALAPMLATISEVGEPEPPSPAIATASPLPRANREPRRVHGGATRTAVTVVRRADREIR
jgi:hypothetical protein